MKGEKKKKSKDDILEKKEESNLCCCYVIDLFGCYVDPCGCNADIYSCG